MEKEAKFMASIKQYIDEHGITHFFDVVPPLKGKLVPKTVHLPTVTSVDLEEFQKDVHKSVSKHKSLYNRFKHIPKVEWIIHRYGVLGYLNNISLSVSPKLKESWGINHELFGAFYNVNLDHSYCSLFPDLEPGSVGNVFSFKPKKKQTILVNPPYTAEWVKWTCAKIIEWKGKANFVIVIPVWDRKTRDELRLKRYPDLPEINHLIEIADQAEVVHLPFYDGIQGRKVELKDPVHLIFVFSGK